MNFCVISNNFLLNLYGNCQGIPIEFQGKFPWNFCVIFNEFLHNFCGSFRGISTILEMNFLSTTCEFLGNSIAVSWKQTLDKFYGISIEWASRSFEHRSDERETQWGGWDTISFSKLLSIISTVSWSAQINFSMCIRKHNCFVVFTHTDHCY